MFKYKTVDVRGPKPNRCSPTHYVDFGGTAINMISDPLLRHTKPMRHLCNGEQTLDGNGTMSVSRLMLSARLGGSLSEIGYRDLSFAAVTV